MKLTQIDRKQAFRYLGYGSNLPDERVLALADICEKRLLAAIDGRYTFRYFSIDYIKNSNSEESDEEKTDNENSNEYSAEVKNNKEYIPYVKLTDCPFVLEGYSIAEHLAGCEGVILFAATISDEVDRLIRMTQVKSMAEAVITDAMASAAIELVCDEAEKEMLSGFFGKYFTWRFSPGYGDLPLETQAEFLKILDAPKRTGINLTAGGLMAPCKSVSAIIGISSNPLSKEKRGCSACLMRDRCAFRQKGEHCGI